LHHVHISHTKFDVSYQKELLLDSILLPEPYKHC
jgi:hypothetical protein